MDIENRTVWQQAAGDTDRNYAEICIRWDVVLNGPGHAGPWPACREALQAEQKWSARKLTDLRRFGEEMTDGGIVVLRIGTATVLAVGEIVGPYEWSDEFGDVDGWDLQHLRRVRWLWHDRANPKMFDTYALKQGDTTQKLGDGPVKEWLRGLRVAPVTCRRSLVPLPPPATQNEIGVAEISDFLFDRGVASSSIASLLSEIGELTRIAKWYQRSSMPSEHETVAYLVVPLLRALGWTPQRMAVEWSFLDLALFSELPRSDGNVRVVVEAKKMDNSCLSAIVQAQNYAEKRPGCQRLILTDGMRYGVYVRRGTEFHLHAYLNLTRLRRDYAVLGCGGAEDALLAMAPEWNPAEAVDA
jgi:hypothetical protein